MLAKYEQRFFSGEELIWVGRYVNLHNISHWHLEHEIIRCEHGGAQIMLNDELFVVQEGDTIFCKSGDVHSINADENSILTVCLFNKSLTKQVTEKMQLSIPKFYDRYNILSRLFEIQREVKTKQQFYECRIAALMSELIVDIFRNEAITDRSIEKTVYLTRYKELLGWIEANIETATFQDAVSFMNMSESYFSRWFKKISGLSFSNYLNTVRVERALDILFHQPSIPVSVLMQECGFSTIRNFNRIFKQTTGYAPTQLPRNFTINVRTQPSLQSNCDPTLKTSVLLSPDNYIV